MPVSEPSRTTLRGDSGPGRSRRSGPWRWFCDLPLAARGLIILAAVFGSFCLFFAEENWRGRHAWENCRRDLEARGVELDWTKFAPPPVPDEQNFAMTPFLAPLFDFNPKPRAPGQPLWRDMAAHDRAVNFAVALLPSNEKGEIPATIFAGRFTDLAGALAALRNRTNSVSTQTAPDRTQTATALLSELEQYNGVLQELRAASKRPECRFNVEYDAEDPISIMLPHYIVLQRVSRVLQVRASAELALGKTDAAFADTELMLYLAGAIRNEPFLIAGMAGGTMLKRTALIIWEGLAERKWSEAQLASLQARLATFTPLKSLDLGLKAERAAFGNAAFRYIRNHKNALRDLVSSDQAPNSLAYLLAGPSGWLFQEQAVNQRLHDQRILPNFDPAAGRVFPSVVEENKKGLEREFQRSLAWNHTGMSKLLLVNLLRLFQRAAFGQARQDHAIIACALERCRLATGAYPASLDALVPRFLNRVPLDVCDGKPMKYRLQPDGQFVLYGVGWNEKDDGGTMVTTADGSDTEPNQGDWIWPAYPKT